MTRLPCLSYNRSLLSNVPTNNDPLGENLTNDLLSTSKLDDRKELDESQTRADYCDCVEVRWYAGIVHHWCPIIDCLNGQFYKAKKKKQRITLIHLDYPMQLLSHHDWMKQRRLDQNERAFGEYICLIWCPRFWWFHHRCRLQDIAIWDRSSSKIPTNHRASNSLNTPLTFWSSADDDL